MVSGLSAKYAHSDELGAKLGQLSACFVLDMPDDMAGIMKASTDTAMIFKSGGRSGHQLLRPETRG